MSGRGRGFGRFLNRVFHAKVIRRGVLPVRGSQRLPTIWPGVWHGGADRHDHEAYAKFFSDSSGKFFRLFTPGSTCRVETPDRPNRSATPLLDVVFQAFRGVHEVLVPFDGVESHHGLQRQIQPLCRFRRLRRQSSFQRRWFPWSG